MSILAGGGIQNTMRNLAVALAHAGWRVDLIVCHGDPAQAPELGAAGVRLFVLRPSAPGVGRMLAWKAERGRARHLRQTVLFPVKTWKKLAYLAALRGYLRAQRPAALLSAMTQCNLVALWALRLARVPCRAVIGEHNMLSHFVTHHRRSWRWRHLPRLVAHCYPRADAVVAVSNAVADDLVATAGLARAGIEVVPNPVIDQTLRRKAQKPPPHAWLADDAIPVVLGVGRLVEQKDPLTLLRAFAVLRKGRRARLVMLGNGPLRQSILDRAQALGVADDVDLPGWINAPFAYFAHASVFVLPSRWEGLPSVLIQALGCGCPVVATDCPGGSAEILGDGRYGALVGVGDVTAMARAIEATLDAPPVANTLIEGAQRYTVEHSAARYALLLRGH